MDYLNRFVCDVLREMRTCTETANYSYLPGLIEEVQYMVNRMEASLYDKKDYNSLKEKIRAAKEELKQLQKEVNTLKNNLDQGVHNEG